MRRPSATGFGDLSLSQGGVLAVLNPGAMLTEMTLEQRPRALPRGPPGVEVPCPCWGSRGARVDTKWLRHVLGISAEIRLAVFVSQLL